MNIEKEFWNNIDRLRELIKRMDYLDDLWPKYQGDYIDLDMTKDEIFEILREL